MTATGRKAALSGYTRTDPIFRMLARLARLGLRLRLAGAPTAPPPRRESGAAPLPGRATSAEAARRELRALLTQQTDGRVPPDAWRLAWSGSGRPLVTGPEAGHRVSIAYAPDLFAVAAATERSVGIDLEPERPIPEDEVPFHLLSPAETALVRQDQDSFLAVWTLKEAFAKERSAGVPADWRTLDVALYARAAPFTLVRRPDGGAACHARFQSGDTTYRIALTFGPRRS